MFELPEERYTGHHWVPFKKFSLDKTQLPMCVTTLSIFNEERASEVLFKEVRKTRLESADLCSITLDPNTAHRNVSLKPNCEGNECATFKSQPLDYPDHPDRFTDCVQVLSKEPLTGRCYFEVCPTGACFIGLTYNSIARRGKGKQGVLGLNDKSWACFGGGYVPQGTDNGTWLLIPNPCTNRVGVYLDYGRGVLTFYSVFTEVLAVLHKSKFTKPLYFGAVFMTPGDHVVIPK
uniref:B30.2/SPRY domain-containing protein n=1 Tax=Neogobius melanostomus TaxID=47308 RepID=A0A8C6SQM1_9GOBI